MQCQCGMLKCNANVECQNAMPMWNVKMQCQCGMLKCNANVECQNAMPMCDSNVSMPVGGQLLLFKSSIRSAY